MSPNLQGALLMMGSMAAFTINDTFIKLTGGDVPLAQLLFLRGVLASILVYALARAVGAVTWDISRSDWWLIALRCASEIAAAYFFLTALFAMPLANATAILQVLPLTVTMGAALFFGESVGWRRWAAIGMGFVGMLLVVQPGSSGFNAASLYALAAVVCVTSRDLATRRMSSQVPSLMVTLAAAVTVMVAFGIASIFQGWAPVSGANATYIVASAACVLGAYLFSVMVMRVGDVSMVAPFRYTALVWALILGWVVFGDWPTPIVLFGAALIVATGLFALYREMLSRREDLSDPV